MTVLTQKGGGWSDFGNCSRTCGEGIKTRVCHRPSNSIFPCQGKSVAKCNMGACSSEVVLVEDRAVDVVRSESGDQHEGKDTKGDADEDAEDSDEDEDADTDSGKDDDADTDSDEPTPTKELQLLIQLSKDGEQRFHPGCCKHRNMFVSRPCLATCQPFGRFISLTRARTDRC